MTLPWQSSLVLVAVLAVAVGAFQPFLQDGTVVQTAYGPIKGLDMNGYRRWQGVPFAMPPLGTLRWRNPSPPGSWEDGIEPLDCRNFTIGCAQLAHGLDVPTNTSEDCLYLEVFAPPAGKYSEPAAVMLFFYGGAFKEGGESFLMYDGAWMTSTTNTILVVPNYRLGVFGFLYADSVDANVGIQDQRFAIQWVNKNIANFGGDPNKVTIFGESAGGQSVFIHLASPQHPVSSMFHRAIIESGPFSEVYRTAHNGLIQSESFGGYLGCKRLDTACIDAKSTKEVLDAAHKTIFPIIGWTEAIMRWAPVVDGSTLRMQVQEAFNTGNIVKVPLMIGQNENDGYLFGYPLSDKGYLPEWKYQVLVTGLIHDKYINEVLDMYPAEENNVVIFSQLLTDYFFTCGARKTLALAEAAGIQERYHYQLTLAPQPCFWPHSQQFCCDEVCHGDELAYVFKPSAITFSGKYVSLQNAVSSYWTSFAHGGTPNFESLSSNIYWPVFNATTPVNINLGWPLTTESDLRKKQCDMWDKVGYDH